MPVTEIATILDQLALAPGPAVARFDPGQPFSGRVAVLPSAFNPPTVAHVALLGLARALPGISTTAAMLTTRNVDKGVHGATMPHRVGMLLALAGHGAGQAVLAANAARIADQAAALRAFCPAADFDFIAGYDTLVRLFEARYYEGNMERTLDLFFAHHRLIAANRAEVTIEGVEQFVRSTPAAARYHDRIVVRELPPHPASLSSTVAREEAGLGGQSPAVPAEVAAYIARHRLYRGS